jgi:FixJ family two-component response regulator
VSPEAVICVVDDDEDVRESIASFFRSAGITTVRFRTAEELLSWPELPTMRCLITDLHMPGMDGLELKDELQRQGSRVPVILMTAFPSAEARQRARDLGIAAFVAKPTDPEALLDQVEALIAG